MLTGRLIAELFAAFIGTIAFALLFSVPRKYYSFCGFIGSAGWLLYRILLVPSGSLWAVFFATVLIVVLSRAGAVRERCPVTIFLVVGIFPLVPGKGIYWTAYYIVTNQLEKAGQSGFSTLKTAVAIVLGILFVLEIPQKYFGRNRHREH